MSNLVRLLAIASKIFAAVAAWTNIPCVSHQNAVLIFFTAQLLHDGCDRFVAFIDKNYLPKVALVAGGLALGLGLVTACSGSGSSTTTSQVESAAVAAGEAYASSKTGPATNVDPDTQFLQSLHFAPATNAPAASLQPIRPAVKPTAPGTYPTNFTFPPAPAPSTGTTTVAPTSSVGNN